MDSPLVRTMNKNGRKQTTELINYVPENIGKVYSAGYSDVVHDAAHR